MKGEFAFLLLSILLGAFGQLALKVSVTSLGVIDLEGENFLATLLKIFTNGWIYLGVFLFVTSMILWLKVISTMELSRAYPTVSLSYLIVFIFSVLFLKEGITLTKLAGLVSICLGVFLLHR